MPDPQVSHYDIVALRNIDDEDFVFEYDRSRGNYPYLIPAGQIKRFPRFLADHGLKHLIDKVLTKRKEKTNNIPLREALAREIVVNEELFQSTPVATEADKLKQEVDRLNAPSELEQTLRRLRGGEKKPEPAPGEEAPPAKDEEKFAGLGPTIDTTDKDLSPSPPKEVVAVPTRKEIYDYAVNKLGMTLDEKTKKEWDKMRVDELLKNVGDPREALA